MDFYSTAAQIIPVLFLAMAFEMSKGRWPWSFLMFATAVGALVVGEAAALTALDAGHATEDQHAYVVYGLMLGTLGVVLDVFIRRVEGTPLFKRWPGWTMLASGLYCLAVLSVTVSVAT